VKSTRSALRIFESLRLCTCRLAVLSLIGTSLRACNCATASRSDSALICPLVMLPCASQAW
jgi:hypothetical protein